MDNAQLLSERAKLADLVGWLQPCIVVDNFIMQQLWLKNGLGRAGAQRARGKMAKAQLSALKEISIWLN